MSAIFTLLYNEFEVIDASLNQLRKTNVLNLPIYAVDNDYPFLTQDMVNQLKDKYDIQIIGEKYNRGSSEGFNELINNINIDYAILYDCDSNPVTYGWDEVMYKLIKNTNLAVMSLMLEVSKNEMIERGYTIWHYEDYTIWKPKAACVQSTGFYDLNYLRQIGGVKQPKKYYGGSESQMFNYWNDEHQIGYLDGYYEIPKNHGGNVNPLYSEYKIMYAHRGYDGSFEDFIKTKQ